jgi:hypothetical protein
MKKQLLITSLALSLVTNAFAQPSAVNAPAVTIKAIATHADTVQAVQQWFHKRRIGGIIWTAIGGAFALRIASVAASSSATGGFASTTGGTVVGIALLGGVPAGIGVGKLTRLRKDR